jgi:hypothetical protein
MYKTALRVAAVLLTVAAANPPSCGARAANCTGTIGNALNGKHQNPIHSEHGRCLGPAGTPQPAQNPPAPKGPWDCYETYIHEWNCKKPGVDPTLFPQNPNS